MKFTRSALASWQGTGIEGTGSVSTESKALNGTPLSFHTRFENGSGTNPEELIAAAHAGCFTMQMSFLLSDAGLFPERLNTAAKITFQEGQIAEIALELTGVVSGISPAEFEKIARKANEICPISKLLSTVITLKVNLLSELSI